MEEIWKDVVGYEEYYQVSNLGRVRSKDRMTNTWHGLVKKKGKLMSICIGSCGYKMVPLSIKGKSHPVLLHRLIAKTFIPNPNNFPYVNHKDENPLNNSIDNLEWCTAKYNINYGTCIERRNKTMRENCKLSKTTLQYNLNGELLNKWKSTMEIERTLGYSNKSISACCIGKQKTAYGYIWKYK